jgi:hypothetical protein
MTQHRTFEIKFMPFQVAEHILASHSALVIAQGQPAIRQVGCQTQGLLFVWLPMSQQIDWINLCLGEIALPQPKASTDPNSVSPTKKTLAPVGNNLRTYFSSANCLPAVL